VREWSVNVKEWSAGKCSEVYLGEVWWSVAKCCSAVIFFWFFFYRLVYGCRFCILLFKFCKLCILIVMFIYSYCYVYIFLLLCLYILIVMHALFCIFSFHRANWHFPITLTEVFPCYFLSCKARTRIHIAKTGHGPHSS
jgi:hypothetical protein